jgi:aspartyl/asparaginyl beta-hydroxylase (cupin superfamily)
MNVPQIVDKLHIRLGASSGLDRVEACLQGFASGRIPGGLHPQHEPTRVFFPGLRAQPWYERDELPWVAGVEERTAAITAELAQLLRGGVRFYPYEDPYTLELGWKGWDTFALYRKGKPNHANAIRCPTAMEALASTPRGPRQGMFSRLTPGAYLAPHSGGVNVVLTCHLGLVVPEGCGIRAGDEVRSWEVGEVLVFDDSFVHEAWNRGSSDRVVLLWDVWHPDLTPIEIRALELVFSTFDQIMRHLGG